MDKTKASAIVHDFFAGMNPINVTDTVMDLCKEY